MPNSGATQKKIINFAFTSELEHVLHPRVLLVPRLHIFDIM